MRIFIRRLSEKKNIIGFLFLWVRICRKNGPFVATQYAWDKHGYDLWHGVDTSQTLVESNIWSEGVTNVDKQYAVDSTSDKIHRTKCAIKYVAKHLNLKKTKLFDLGCGKGKVLIFAKNYNFKNLYGIELSTNVAKICAANLKVKKVKHTLIVDSMRNVKWNNYISDEDQILLYAYNPTSRKILLETISQILTILQKGKIVLIYTNPQSTFSIENNVEFNILRKFHKIDIYKVKRLNKEVRNNSG